MLERSCGGQFCSGFQLLHVFSFVGIRSGEVGSGANHHTPQFDLDERAMVTGVMAAVAYARAFLLAPPETAVFAPLCGSMAELMDMVERQPGAD